MIRQPVVAGQFYPGTKAALEKALSALVDLKTKEKEKVLGAVSPHAGYIYSGPVAGKVFSRFAPKKLFIIIGPNHTGMGEAFSVSTADFWKTPLGNAQVDKELADYLTKNSNYLKSDEVAHAYEHSIEVQLPFLQYVIADFKILPICVAASDITALRSVANELAESIGKLDRDVTIIASSDMTHYEPQDAAKKKDMEAISAILAMDEDELMKKVNRMNISMCGVIPVFIALAAVKAMGAKQAKLIDYKTSGDVTGDYSSVVGYGGVIIT